MHVRTNLTPFNDSFVMRSDKPATKALVFVHGFAGDAWSTWSYCQYLADWPAFEKDFAHVDLFFFDYQSTKNIVAKSAKQLRAFVDACVSPMRPYESIRFVAHSLGSVIVRQLVVDWVKEIRSAQEWPVALASQPLLFGNALFGFKHSVALWQALAAMPLLSAAAALSTLTVVKVYSEIEANTSFLDDLRGMTKELHDDKHAAPATAAKLYWGEDENIVVLQEMLIDKREKFEPGYDHVSICKAPYDNQQVMTWIRDAL